MEDNWKDISSFKEGTFSKREEKEEILFLDSGSTAYVPEYFLTTIITIRCDMVES